MSPPDKHVAGSRAQLHGENPPVQRALSSEQLREAIRQRAEQLYEESGRISGRDLANWTQAEAEICAEHAMHLSRKPAVVVRVEGVQYVGEYDCGLAFGYTPGEFAAGDRVRIRFDSGKMFVIRPNGQHLETTIIARIG